MKCFNCETENPESAVFCKKCGRRLDGLAVCSACGKLTPQDGEFCINCGSNRNAPVHLMPVRFPAAAENRPSSGFRSGEERAGARAKAAAAGEVAAAEEKPRKALVKGKGAAIMDRISFFCGCAAALFGIIFVFLIGCAPVVEAGGVSAGGGVGFNLFYFFGDAFNAIPAGDGMANQAATTGAILGLVCSVIALAGTVLCFVFTVVRLVKILTKKTEKSILAPAAATYFAFICGAALFMLCMAQKAELSGVATKMSLSGGAVAGIVLGAIALAAALVLSVLVKGISSGRSFILSASCSLLYAIFACVAAGLIGSCAVAVTASAMGISTNATYGINSFFGALSTAAATLLASDPTPEAWNEFLNMYDMSVVSVVILLVAAVAFCAFFVMSVSACFSSMGEKLGKRTLLGMVFAGICAAVAGVMMCIASSGYANWLGSGTAANLAVPIVIIVFGVLMCACAVVYKLFAKKTENKAQESAEPTETEEPAENENA